MAVTFNALIAGIVPTLLWAAIGLPLAARLLPPGFALPAAPAVGWAVHSAALLPVFMMVGLSRGAVTAGFALPVIAALVLAWRTRQLPSGPSWRSPAFLTAMAFAALLAAAVMAAVLPKLSADGVALASPIFDHSKIAMIDDMVRLGVPPGNPFFGATGVPARLSYYYLWHFSAAEVALLTGFNGWEADAGLTWFTAFASLGLMAALAAWFSGNTKAAFLVVILAATGSMRPLLYALADSDRVDEWAGDASGFAGWLFQTSWAPQHVAAAMCAILAALALLRLSQKPSLPVVLIAALMMAAGYESSVWVGGITFAVAAAAIGPMLLTGAAPRARLRLLLWLVAAAAMALAAASLFLYDQWVSTALHGGGFPIAVHPQTVIDFDWPHRMVRALDLPAYWLIFLVVEFPAFYLAGAVTLILSLTRAGPIKDFKPELRVFGLMTAASLCVGWLLVSTLGENNDLGWRGVLPAVMLLIVFAAAGLTQTLHKRAFAVSIAALALLALGIPDGGRTIYRNIVADPAPSSKAFTASGALWEALRRHTGPADRVAINPYFMADLTPWPIDIGWALLSDRRSCYAGSGYAPFIPLPPAGAAGVETLFARVYDGHSTPDDIANLAAVYRCDVVLVTKDDAAWRNDPFAATPVYRLVEDGSGWRIYKVNVPR